jgi:hypothetical protein
MAISACPMTVAQILDLADKIERDEIRVDELVDGLLDFAPAEELAAIEEGTDDEEEEDGDEEDDAGAASALAAENLERLRVAALEKFVLIRKLYKRLLTSLEKEGASGKSYLKVRADITSELMGIRFSAARSRSCATSSARSSKRFAATSARSRTCACTRSTCRARTSSRSSRQRDERQLDQARDLRRASVQRAAHQVQPGDLRRAAGAAAAAGLA